MIVFNLIIKRSAKFNIDIDLQTLRSKYYCINVDLIMTNITDTSLRKVQLIMLKLLIFKGMWLRTLKD
jgi:hypothetical protein